MMADYDTTPIKQEILEIEIDLSHKDTHLYGLCSVCLCVSPDTSVLVKETLKCYLDIVRETQLPCLAAPRLCCACASLLRRATQYMQQVKRSHTTLHSVLQCDKEEIEEQVRRVSRPHRLQVNDCGSIHIPGRDEDDDEDDDDDDDDDDDGGKEPSSEKDPINLIVDTDAATENDHHSLQESEKNTQTNENSPKSLTILTTEEMSKLNNLRLKCDHCDYHTVSPQALERHMHLHDEKRPYQCHVCEKGFTRNDALKRHMATHFGKEEGEAFDKKKQCNVCKKRFSRRSYVKSHMMSHTGEKPFTCVICQYACSSGSQLKNHMRTHSGEKPYKCKLCDKGFVTTSELRRHITTHADKRPYQCEVCQKAFNYKNNLREHMIAKHSEEKPYQCAVCDKRFTRSCDLKTHMKMHSGVKPHPCKLCVKGYVKRCDLLRHLEVAHPV